MGICTLKWVCRSFSLVIPIGKSNSCVHSHHELPFRKGYVGHNPSGHNHLPIWQKDYASVVCPWHDFVIFFVVVAFTFIVVWDHLLRSNGLVLILLGNIIFLAGGRSGREWSVLGGVSPCRCCGLRRVGAGSLGQLLSQPPPTEIHPPPSSDKECYTKYEWWN